MEQIVLFVVQEGTFIVLMTMKEFILVAVRTMQEIAQEGYVEMKLVRQVVKKNGLVSSENLWSDVLMTTESVVWQWPMKTVIRQRGDVSWPALFALRIVRIRPIATAHVRRLPVPREQHCKVTCVAKGMCVVIIKPMNVLSAIIDAVFIAILKTASVIVFTATV